MSKTRCMSCGKELEYNRFCCPAMCDECNSKWLLSVNIEGIDIGRAYMNSKISIGVPCIICGEIVKLTELEESITRGREIFKVCDKCKQAVMKMREQIKGE